LTRWRSTASLLSLSQCITFPISSHLKNVLPCCPKYIFALSSLDHLIDTDKAQIPSNRWTSLTHRRLQAHPSQLTKNQTLLAAPLPKWLSDQPAPILTRFGSLGVFQGCSAEDGNQPLPNHVLVNEYLPGQGIMPHEDGSAYWPVVATVSLGASLVLDLYEKKEDEEAFASKKQPRYRIFQEPGSLLVTRGSAYDSMLHGIDGVEVDENLGPMTIANWELLSDKKAVESGQNGRETRISLTYRVVRKVSKVNMAMLGIGGKR